MEESYLWDDVYHNKQILYLAQLACIFELFSLFEFNRISPFQNLTLNTSIEPTFVCGIKPLSLHL